ncbi:hypothetical protein ACXR6G_01965 [Ancylomarina sp. YFZ004]
MITGKDELVEYLNESLGDMHCCAFDFRNDDRMKLSKIISDIANTLNECTELDSLDDYYKSDIQLMYGNIQSVQNEELAELMKLKIKSPESKKNNKMNAIKNQMERYINQLT